MITSWKKLSPIRIQGAGDGKTIAYINLGRHIKALHEPPVKFKICDKEFNITRLSHHMRKWHKGAEENNNIGYPERCHNHCFNLKCFRLYYLFLVF
jgi:hypothetical protein